MIRIIEFRAMNTTVMLAAEGQWDIEGMQATKGFIDECEQRFSRFLPGSELSELNRSTGEWMPVSAELFEMLQLSLNYYRETNGIFDPSIMMALKNAGYNRSMDEIRAKGAVDYRPASIQSSKNDFSTLAIDPLRKRVRIPPGTEIDLGGIAKGWIVNQAARHLHQYSKVCGVSAGGDILFIGQPEDGLNWDVYLEDPRDPSQMLAQLHLPSGAVATSSVMKRIWRQGGRSLHHLIDPRTGTSAQTEWLSVTVLCSDVIAADVYAKTILIGGQRVAEKLIETKPELTFIAVDPEGNLVGSPNFKEYMYEPASDIFLAAGTTR